MRGKGCQLDAGKHRYTPLGIAMARGLVNVPVPAKIDCTPWAAPLMDQGPSSGCEGHSSSFEIYTVLKRNGHDLGWVPSPLGIYTTARCLDRANLNVPLTDDGTQTNSVIRSIAEFGIRPMGQLASDGRYSDCDPATINNEPRLGEIEQDAHTLIVGAYQITTTGDQKLADLKAAFASGFAVRIDSFVDSAFEDWTPAAGSFGVPDLRDPKGGGHALGCLGYDGDDVWLRNSWGKWGDGAGNILVSKAFVAQADVFAWKVSVASK